MTENTDNTKQRQKDYQERLDLNEKIGQQFHAEEQVSKGLAHQEIRKAGKALLFAMKQDHARNIDEMLETQVKALHQAYKILTANALSNKDIDFLKFSLVAQEQCRRTAATHKWINGTDTPLPPQNDIQNEGSENAK